jgi:hypothetical protein
MFSKIAKASGAMGKAFGQVFGGNLTVAGG